MAKSNRQRLSEIVSVLGKYGLSHIYRIYLRSKDQTEDARRLRLAFEELGPSFIKIGQILSTRQDLLPESYIKELQLLQDEAPTISFDIIKEIILTEFGQSPDQLFASLDPVPIASASVAQVHRAELLNGDQVIVKVQRPNIEQQLMQDIHLFSRLMSMAPEGMTDMISNVDAAFDEIEKSTQRELNFRTEARSIMRFKANFFDSDLVDTPRPYMNLTTQRVLVEEFVDGIPISKKEKLLAEGYILEDIAAKLVASFLSQVFDYGFYHSDPHPGNIIVKDKKLVFIDFGMTGEISESMRQVLVEMIRSTLTEDTTKLMNLILQVASTKEKVDDVFFYDDLNYYFNKYSTKSLKNLDFNQAFNELMTVIQKHKLALPHELVTLARAIIILEGLVAELSPDLDLMSILKDFYKNSDAVNLIEFPSKERLLFSTYDSLNKLSRVPSDLSKIANQIANGRLVVNANLTDIEEHWDDIEQMVNRLIYALILASLILASAVIVALSSGGVSIIAIIVFLIAAVVGGWLLVSIFRSGMF